MFSDTKVSLLILSSNYFSFLSCFYAAFCWKSPESKTDRNVYGNLRLPVVFFSNYHELSSILAVEDVEASFDLVCGGEPVRKGTSQQLRPGAEVFTIYIGKPVFPVCFRAFPFGKLQKIWAMIWRDAIFLLFLVCSAYLDIIARVQVLRESRDAGSWVEQRFIPELLSSSKFQDFSRCFKTTKWSYL